MKSRSLSFNEAPTLKPTKSYIRESIFNIIGVNKDMACLDLFSGSGILAAEAISRGTYRATLVENNFKTCQKIHSEFRKLNICNYDLIHSNVFTFLKNHKNKSYEIIFLDPPFEMDYLSKTLRMLNEHGFLEENQYIYIEQNKKDHNPMLVSFISKTHNVLKDLSIGDVSYTIAKKRDK